MNRKILSNDDYVSQTKINLILIETLFNSMNVSQTKTNLPQTKMSSQKPKCLPNYNKLPLARNFAK